MKVLDLLDEIEEIFDTASGFPLTGKIMVEGSELLDIVNEIRTALPDDIQQAQWIKNERDRILGEAKTEYETVLKDAQSQAEGLTEESDIMVKARKRADDLLENTQSNIRQLKMSTYDYIDSILFDFQEKMDRMSDMYFGDMFSKLEGSFNDINTTLAENREEIKEMAYRTSMNIEDRAVKMPQYEPEKEKAAPREDIPEGADEEEYEEYYEEDENR